MAIGPKLKARKGWRRGNGREFNLVYDRGPPFGPKTGGTINAILMGLLPEAVWSRLSRRDDVLAVPVGKLILGQIAGGEGENGDDQFGIACRQRKAIEHQKGFADDRRRPLLLPSTNGWLRAMPKA